MRSSHSTLLGLSFETGKLVAVVMKRTATGAQLRQSLTAPLSLDPLTSDPVLVGREIRNTLTEAGIKTSRCLVALPLKWALSHCCDLPDIEAEDVDSYLEIQAEREFPFGPEDLMIATSNYKAGGDTFATMTAVPRNHLATIETALRAAKIRPVSAALAITALRPRDARPETGNITLLVSDEAVEMMVTQGEEIVVLRSLEEPVTNNPAGFQVDADHVAHQLRITLGRLGDSLRASIQTVRVFGPSAPAKTLLDDLSPALSRMGLQGALGVDSHQIDDTRERASSEPPLALCAAVGDLLTEGSTRSEFLPPRVSRLKAITNSASSRGALWLSAAVILLLLVGVGALIQQHIKLFALEKEYALIEPTAVKVEGLQSKVKQFRPWFDDAPVTLVAVQELAKAFPESGGVWAKTLEIKDQKNVSFTAYARTKRDLDSMRADLNGMPGMTNVQFKGSSGVSPIQFRMQYELLSGVR